MFIFLSNLMPSPLCKCLLFFYRLSFVFFLSPTLYAVQDSIVLKMFTNILLKCVLLFQKVLMSDL